MRRRSPDVVATTEKNLLDQSADVVTGEPEKRNRQGTPGGAYYPSDVSAVEPV
jgi:hypothetical protein